MDFYEKSPVRGLFCRIIFKMGKNTKAIKGKAAHASAAVASVAIVPVYDPVREAELKKRTARLTALDPEDRPLLELKFFIEDMHRVGSPNIRFFDDGEVDLDFEFEGCLENERIRVVEEIKLVDMTKDSIARRIGMSGHIVDQLMYFDSAEVIMYRVAAQPKMQSYEEAYEDDCAGRNRMPVREYLVYFFPKAHVAVAVKQ